MLPELLTVDDVARLLHRKPAAVRALANRGEVGFHRVGKFILFPPSEIEDYLSRTFRPARRQRALRG